MSANFFSRAVSSTSRKSLGVVAAAVVLSAAFTVPVLYTPHAALADSTSAVQSALAPGFASVVDIVKPAVVNIATERQQTSSTRHPNTEGQSLRDLLERHLGHQQRPVTGQGSGFLVSAKGEVVTNYHVIAHADEIVVTLDDGRKLPATLVGVDRRTDLALLRVEHDTPFPYVDIASAHTVRVGDWVLAIGNPFGLGGSVTAGIVSARGRDLGSGPYDDFIQVDAPINRVMKNLVSLHSTCESSNVCRYITAYITTIDTAIIRPNFPYFLAVLFSSLISISSSPFHVKQSRNQFTQ